MSKRPHTSSKLFAISVLVLAGAAASPVAADGGNLLSVGAADIGCPAVVAQAPGIYVGHAAITAAWRSAHRSLFRGMGGSGHAAGDWLTGGTRALAFGMGVSYRPYAPRVLDCGVPRAGADSAAGEQPALYLTVDTRW